MTRLALLLALLVAAGCATTRSALEVGSMAAARAGWEGAGLELDPAPSCRIHAFRVVHARSLESFQRTCAAPGTQPSLRKAWACLVWRLEAPRVRTMQYPAAVLSPLVDPASVPSLARHEALHAIVYCTSLWPAADPYDGDHQDPRVWQTGGAGSAEQLARRAAQGVPAHPPNSAAP